MKTLGLALAVTLFVSTSQADLATDANTILQKARGPFGPVELQKATIRIDANSPPDGYFKSAFRTPEAQVLARQHGLYFGNLFTTNYFELTGEFVFGDPDSNHPLAHTELLQRAKEANPRATTMIRNWILEKHYLRTLPESNLVKVYGLRAISDIESEASFAHFFFDIYLAGVKDEFQFLLAILLIRESPVSDSPSLAEARMLVANEYPNISFKWGNDDPKTLRYYQVRNLIHNQTTKETVKEIDRFFIDVPEYKTLGWNDLARVREILVEYFAAGPEKLVELARDLGPEVANATALFASQDKSAVEYNTQLLAISQKVADLKFQLVGGGGYRSRTQTLHFISVASQYLAKEVLALSRPNSDSVRILLNCVYSEGFLIRDNWTYFHGEIDHASTPLEIKRVLQDIADVSSATLTQSMSSTPALWESFEPRMADFADSAIKSSSLSLLSAFAARIR